MGNANFIKIGHRGACGYEPENTLSSFKKALELGVDMIECDVWMTKDNKIVVIHDSTLNRTTNGVGLVADYTYEELTKFTIKKTEKIPLLVEVLELTRGKVKFNIEVKTKAVGKYLAQEILDSNFPITDILVSSNDIPTIQYIQKKIPELKIAWVFRAVDNPPVYVKVIKKLIILTFKLRRYFPFLQIGWLIKLLTYPIGQLIWGMAMLGILPLTHFIIIERLLNKQINSISLYYLLVTKGLIKRLHKFDKNVLLFTVNNKKRIKKYKSWGVDGIFSNFPDRL